MSRNYVRKLPVPEPGKFRCRHPREGNTYCPPKRPNIKTCRQCRIDRAKAQRDREAGRVAA